jgi:hypothetical protein
MSAPNETPESEPPVVTLLCKMMEHLSEGLDDVRRKERWVVRELAECVAKIVERDPHQWSSRPCHSCATISALLDRPFGCDARRLKP